MKLKDEDGLYTSIVPIAIMIATVVYTLAVIFFLSGCAQSWENVDFELYRMRDSVPDEPLTSPERERLAQILGRENRPITLSDIEPYLKDCWDDSTRHDRCREETWAPDEHKYCKDSTHTYPGGCGDPGCLALHYKTEPRYYFTHRPPTLEGFVEWMKGER